MKPGTYIYCWGPRLYPGRDIVKYAKGLGVVGVVLHSSTPAAIVAEAVLELESVYFWSFPGAFLPHNAAETTREMVEQCVSFGADGIIVDPENAPEWVDSREAIEGFSEVLDEARTKVDVGLTSFPYWPFVEQLAPHVNFGSPQLYGRSGTTNPQVFANWRRKWDASMREVIPSIWPQKNRDANAQRKYLSIFKDERTNIIFQSPVPKVGTASFGIQKEFATGAANHKPGPKDESGPLSC